jgi:hypothetical protein
MPWATNGEDLAGITLKAVTIKLGKTRASVSTPGCSATLAAGPADGSALRHAVRWHASSARAIASRCPGDLQFMTRVGLAWRRIAALPTRGRRSSQSCRRLGEVARSYLHGDQVILFYTVGGCRVLELPELNIRMAAPCSPGRFSRALAPRHATAALRADHDGRSSGASCCSQGITLFGDLRVGPAGPRGARLDNRGNSRLVLNCRPVPTGPSSKSSWVRPKRWSPPL